MRTRIINGNELKVYQSQVGTLSLRLIYPIPVPVRIKFRLKSEI